MAGLCVVPDNATTLQDFQLSSHAAGILYISAVCQHAVSGALLEILQQFLWEKGLVQLPEEE